MKEKSMSVNILAKSMLNILNFILPVLVAPYLARILDPNLYASYNEATSLLTWFILFASFGIYNYGLRCISMYKNNKDKSTKLYSSLFMFGIITSTLTLIVYLIYVLFIRQTDKILYLVLSLQIVANVFYIEWVNEAVEDYVFILFKTSTLRIINVVSIFLFVRNANDIVIYALITSLTILLNNLFSYIHIRKNIKFKMPSKNDLIHQVKPLTNMFLMANASMLFTSLDKLMLSFFNTGIEISYYTFSQQILLIITNVLNSILLASIPRLSNYIGEQKINDYNKLLNQVGNLFLLIAIPVSIGISVLSTNVMLIYGGENYIMANEVLFIFGIRNILSSLILLYAQLIIFVNGHEKYLTKVYIICGISNLILNIMLLLLKMYNAKYFILTTVIAEIFEFLLEAYFIKSYIKFVDTKRFKTKQYIAMCLPFFVIVFLVNRLYPFQTITINFIINTVVSIIICSLVYACELILTKDEGIYILLNKIKNIILVKILKRTL